MHGSKQQACFASPSKRAGPHLSHSKRWLSASMWCYMLAITWGGPCWCRARQVEAGSTPPRDKRHKPKWNASNKGNPGLERRWAPYTSTVCTLFDFKGATKGWNSCASSCFGGARRGTAYASQATTARMGLQGKPFSLALSFAGYGPNCCHWHSPCTSLPDGQSPLTACAP